MKKLIKTVDLSFFQDDATGDFGLCHTDTQSQNGDSFNAFWTGTGIFHDVFEHSHEYTNKYFRGQYAMNIGGEMSAMGAMWYYIDELGLGNRLNNRSIYSPGEIMKRSTMDLVQDSIESGNYQYGDTLESNVPFQKPTNNGELEYQISDYWKKAKNFKIDKTYTDDFESGLHYKKTVTFRKIADLHRYGFRMAEKLVANNWENRNTLYNFLEFWDTFCKENNAEEMNNNFYGMTVKLYKNENGEISWKAVLKSRFPSELSDAVLTENSRFSIEDCYIISDEN